MVENTEVCHWPAPSARARSRHQRPRRTSGSRNDERSSSCRLSGVYVDFARPLVATFFARRVFRLASGPTARVRRGREIRPGWYHPARACRCIRSGNSSFDNRPSAFLSNCSIRFTTSSTFSAPGPPCGAGPPRPPGPSDRRGPRARRRAWTSSSVSLPSLFRSSFFKPRPSRSSSLPHRSRHRHSRPGRRRVGSFA